MTVLQKRKILQKIASLEKDIETLERVKIEIAASGYASATMSSGSGSRSYTRLDLDKIQTTIDSLQKQMQSYRKMLGGNTSGITQTYTVYC